MAGIETFRRKVLTYNTFTLAIYDRQEQIDSLLPMFALEHDNRQAREDPVRFDQVFNFPEVYPWEDQIVATAALDRLEWTVPLRGWGAAIPYNRIDIDRPQVIAKLEQVVAGLPIAMKRKRLQLVLDIFRKNPLTADGQNFWSTTHVHPGDKGTYSTILQFPYADQDVPTETELSLFMDQIAATLLQNSVIQSQLVSQATMKDNLHVITHSLPYYSAFERLLTTDKFALTANRWFNGFSLHRDMHPAAGTANYFEVIHSEPGGLRPAVITIDTNPNLDAVERPKANDSLVYVEFSQIFGVKPLHPQPCMQGRPATG